MKKIWEIIRETTIEARRDNLPIFAAGFSYYLLFSIIPLMIVVMAVAGEIIEARQARSALMRQLALLFDPAAADSLTSFLRSVNITFTHAGFAGSLLVLYGASRVFTVLQQAIGQIWDKEEKRRGGFRGAVEHRLRSAGLVLLPVVFVLLCFVFDTLFSALSVRLTPYNASVIARYVLPLMSYGLSLCLFAAVFATINRLLPLRKPSWKDVWVGAVITTFVFAVGRFLFTSMLRFTKFSAHFGPAGAVILVLVWIYFSMLVFLYGSELTRVYALKHGSWSKPAGAA